MMRTLLTASISGALLILIVLLFRLVFKGRVNPKWQYALWAVALVRLLLPVQLPVDITLPFLTAQESPAPVVTTPPDASDVLPHADHTPAYEADLPSPSDPLPQSGGAPVAAQGGQMDAGLMLTIIWIAGAGMTALCLTLINLRFYGKLRRSSAKADPHVTGIYHALCRELGLRRAPELLLSDKVAAPCLVGIARPRIILTRDAAESGTVLRHVLLHELSHWRRRDNIVLLLRNAALVLHWFNPAVWLGAKTAAIDCELSCDAAVLLGIADKEEYGESIVKMASGAGTRALIQPILSVGGGKGQLKSRVHLIITRPAAKAPCVVALILTASLLLLSACGFSAAQAAEADAPPADTTQPATLSAEPPATTAPPAASTPSRPDITAAALLSDKAELDMEVLRLLAERAVTEEDIITRYEAVTVLEHVQDKDDSFYPNSVVTWFSYDVGGEYELTLGEYAYPGEDAFLYSGALSFKSDTLSDNTVSLPCRTETLEEFIDACQKGEPCQLVTKLSPDGQKHAVARYNIKNQDVPSLVVYSGDQKTVIPVKLFAPVQWSPDSRYLYVPLLFKRAHTETVILYDSKTNDCIFVMPLEDIFVEAQGLGVDVADAVYMPSSGIWAADSKTFTQTCSISMPNTDEDIALRITFDVAAGMIVHSELVGDGA